MARHHAVQPHLHKVQVPPGCVITGCNDQSLGRAFQRASDGAVFRICDEHYEQGMERVEQLRAEGQGD